jgi:hypothetical protein
MPHSSSTLDRIRLALLCVITWLSALLSYRPLLLDGDNGLRLCPTYDVSIVSTTELDHILRARWMLEVLRGKAET